MDTRRWSFGVLLASMAWKAHLVQLVAFAHLLERRYRYPGSRAAYFVLRAEYIAGWHW